MQGRDTCFKYFTPCLFFWLRISQKWANGVTQRERRNPQRIFSFLLPQSSFLQLKQLLYNSDRRPSGSHRSCPPQAEALISVREKHCWHSVYPPTQTPNWATSLQCHSGWTPVICTFRANKKQARTDLGRKAFRKASSSIPRSESWASWDQRSLLDAKWWSVSCRTGGETQTTSCQMIYTDAHGAFGNAQSAWSRW